METLGKSFRKSFRKSLWKSLWKSVGKSFWTPGLLALLVVACAQVAPAPTSTQVPAPAPTLTSAPVLTEPSPDSAQVPGSTALTTTDTGLQYRDLVVGTGEEAGAGATAVVHYTGWLLDGTEFDSSLDGGSPLSFTIGAGQVIQGWDQGVVSMRVGGKRELTIPPDLAYSDQGAAGGVIPPGATLIFEVELLELR